MEIRFMGTGAADFSPLLETEYQNSLCPNARRSSSVLLGGKVLIDCGPHVLDSFRIQGIDPAQVTDLLVTHFHSDHFCRENVEKLAALCPQPLRMWYRQSAQPEPIPHVEFHPLAVGEQFQTPDIQAVALASNHREHPLHYDIQWQDKRIFYGCDGAWLLNETFYAMMKREYDFMILDATVGDYNGDYRLGEHNSIPMIRLMEASFRSQKVLKENGVICLSHLARTLHPTHEENVQNLSKDGYLVAYDGLTVTL